MDGCYSFWQGGAFPILADLLRQQQAARPAGAAAQSAATGLRAAAAAARPAAGGAAAGGSDSGAAVRAPPDATVAARLSKLLLGEVPEGSDGDASPRADDPGREPSLSEWGGDLPKLTPLAAVERRQAELQCQLDAAVEASLDAEEQYRAAAGQAAGGPLQQEALAALDRAADLQKVRGLIWRDLVGGVAVAWVRSVRDTRAAQGHAPNRQHQLRPTQPLIAPLPRE